MEKVIEKAIEESYNDYRYRDERGVVTCERSAHEWGWKEGYEWILTELNLKLEIPSATVKKYMDKINKV